MKISMGWLSDYVPLPSREELSHGLTMAGLEVEQMTDLSAGLRGVVVGKILESSPHPNADKLSVTRVDAGASEALQVVCGATNYKVGDRVPLATAGTTLPNGVTISEALVRGVLSQGMLCSSKELGLSSEASGLLILDSSAPVGEPIARVLGLEDWVFELNVTPNRSDALCHLGVARDVSALRKVPLTLPDLALREGGKSVETAASVRIEDGVRCPRYAARVIEGVRVGPSPEWLVRRLRACGVRSINNVVDVTNYVLLECGQPLHAFDLDLLSDAQIVVRRAKPGEKLTTLDGKERGLDPEDLVIADPSRPLALAGVMGGASSEVSEKTSRILLESAWFQPIGVRRSANRHALHTEASHRFERGVDPEGTLWALGRAAKLISELAGGTLLRGAIDVHPRPAPRRKIELRHSHVGELLGVEVPAREIEDILTRLGFEKVDSSAQSATFLVPSVRMDVEQPVDLIEEVARIRGYEAVPLAPHRALVQAPAESPRLEVDRRMRSALAGLGFNEVLNYSFVDPQELKRLEQPAQWIISNPLSAQQSVLRTTLFAGLLQNVSRSVRHQVSSLRFYEMGRVFFARPPPLPLDEPAADERPHLAAVLAGARHQRSWALPPEPVDFYDLKGAVEAILASVGLAEGARFEPLRDFTQQVFHPAEAAWVYVDNRRVGRLGRFHPLIQKALDLPVPVYGLELELDEIISRARLIPKFHPVSRFPAVLRDLAVLVDDAVTVEEVEKAVRAVGGPWVERVTLFDIYKGEAIPKGKKNLALSIEYRASDRTLTDSEANAVHSKIVEEMARRVGASLRGTDADPSR